MDALHIDLLKIIQGFLGSDWGLLELIDNPDLYEIVEFHYLAEQEHHLQQMGELDDDHIYVH